MSRAQQPPVQQSPPQQRTEIVFPALGVNRNYLRSNQNQFQQGYLAQFQPSSTPDALNWWPYDVQFGRLRGGVRAPVVAIPAAPGGSGNIQALIASAFSNPSNGLLLGDFFMYIDRLGTPQAVFGTAGSVAVNGYVAGLETILSTPTTGQFFDVSSTQIAPAGASVPAWGVYIATGTGASFPTNSGKPPYGLAYGIYTGSNTNVIIDNGGGLFFNSPLSSPIPSEVGQSETSPVFSTGYPHAIKVQASMQSISGLNVGTTSQFIGVGTGYPPLSGTTAFNSEEAYISLGLVDASGTAAAVVQLSTTSTSTPAFWFQNTATEYSSTLYLVPESTASVVTANVGMLIIPGVPSGSPTFAPVPTYTAQAMVNQELIGKSVLFAPVNSTLPQIYSYGSLPIAEEYTIILAGAKSAPPPPVKQETLGVTLSYSGSSAGRNNWTTAQTLTYSAGANFTISDIQLSTAAGSNNFSLTFVDQISGSAGFGTNTITGINTTTGGSGSFANGTIVTIGVNVGALAVAGPSFGGPAAFEYRVMDGRCVIDTFPYDSNMTSTGLDVQSLSAWSSTSAAITPSGPLSQFIGGTANTTAFNVGAMTTANGFVQGVSCSNVGWNGAMLNTLATANVVSGTLMACVTVGPSPNIGSTNFYGSQAAMVIGPVKSSSFGTWPFVEVNWSPDTGTMNLLSWYANAATNSATILQTYTSQPYFSQTSPAPVTIGLQNQGGTLTMMLNGVAVGNPVALNPDIGMLLNEGNITSVSIGIAAGISTVGPSFTFYSLSVLPAADANYTFGSGINQYLAAIANGQVSIYAASQGTYTLAGTVSQTYFNTSGPVSACYLDEFIYATDGVHPIAVIDVATNSVNALVATAGVVPNPVQLCCEWRSRLVTATGTQVIMSRINVPTDWDTSQIAVDPGSAVDLSEQQQAGLIGTIPSPITALMPAGNQVLAFGCVDSVWAMVGDPGAGGTIVNLNRGSGVFGANAWCRDDAGNLFWANNSGLFVWTGNGLPVNLSFNQYNQFFQNIDGSNDTVTLQFDPKFWYIYIFVQPNNGSAGTHLTVDLRQWQATGQAGFWPIQLPAQVGPYCSTFVNGGNTAQRSIVMGGGTGGLFTFNTTGAYSGATYLDLGTYGITNSITLGPLHVVPPVTDVIVNAIDMTFGELASGDNTNAFGGTTTIYGGKSAYDVTDGTAAVNRPVPFAADWNHPFTCRARGSWFTCVVSAGAGQYASMEHITLTVQAEGRQR